MKTTTAIRWAVATATIASTGAASAQISLYEFDGFGGRSYSSNHSVSNLADTGFNDRASSVVVRGGRWQVCSDAYFGGRCETLGPGEYRSLQPMGLGNKISSVRSLGWTPDGGGGWGSTPPPQWGGGNASSGGNWGSGSRAILYSSFDLSGDSLVVPPSGFANLDWKGFNDKAKSLRVEAGYWIFCSDANYQGNCHTYGPGDYPTLPSGQSHSISSGRRVSGNYPYRNNPDWGY